MVRNIFTGQSHWFASKKTDEAIDIIQQKQNGAIFD